MQVVYTIGSSSLALFNFLLTQDAEVMVLTDAGSISRVNWISVKEKLPTGVREAVLVLCAFNTMFIAYLEGNRWYAITPKGGVPLTFIPFYWMPLPEPPKGAENED